MSAEQTESAAQVGRSPARLVVAPPVSGPRTAVTAAITRRLFTAALGGLPVTVRVADRPGYAIGTGGPEAIICRPEEFFARLGRDGLIGFGEAWMTGAWESEDLAGFLTVLGRHLPSLVPGPLQALRSAYVRRPPRRERGDQADTQRVVAHHYDLSNELFALFLDKTMTYSSALFDPAPGERDPGAGPDPSVELETLESAQLRKIDRLLDLAEVGEGSRVLEIGTGWGALAITAARRGAHVTTMTLSVEQAAEAAERFAAAGVADRIDIQVRDYRDADGSFDAIVSVEMIEAVGWRHWSTYFRTIDRVLAPGGKVALQAITMPHDRMLATKHTYTWIQKYIFPGGFLPSPEVLDEVTREDTSLRIVQTDSLGEHYAETLRRWDQRFQAAAEEVEALGFDETFRRLWHFYLCYSEAGFASGYLDDLHLVLAREDD